MHDLHILTSWVGGGYFSQHLAADASLNKHEYNLSTDNDKSVWFQAMFFWDVTHRWLVVSYWRFGTTCWSQNVGN